MVLTKPPDPADAAGQSSPSPLKLVAREDVTHKARNEEGSPSDPPAAPVPHTEPDAPMDDDAENAPDSMTWPKPVLSRVDYETQGNWIRIGEH